MSMYVFIIIIFFFCMTQEDQDYYIILNIYWFLENFLLLNQSGKKYLLRFFSKPVY